MGVLMIIIGFMILKRLVKDGKERTKLVMLTKKAYKLTGTDEHDVCARYKNSLYWDYDDDNHTNDSDSDSDEDDASDGCNEEKERDEEASY